MSNTRDAVRDYIHPGVGDYFREAESLSDTGIENSAAQHLCLRNPATLLPYADHVKVVFPLRTKLRVTVRLARIRTNCPAHARVKHLVTDLHILHEKLSKLMEQYAGMIDSENSTGSRLPLKNRR